MEKEYKRPFGLVVAHCISSGVIYPLCYHIMRYRRRIVRSNIEKCFPEKSEAERRQIERRFYHHFADMIVEMIHGRHMDKATMARHFASTQQAELANDSIAYGGIIVALGHVFNWEWVNTYGDKMSDYGVMLGGVYKHLSNSFFNKLSQRMRLRENVCLIDNRVLLRTMVKLRKEQKPMFYGLVADQRPEPNGLNHETTLLGQPVGMIMGPEILGKRFNFPVYYAHISTVKRGFYQVTTEKIYDPDTEKDLPEGVVTQRFTDRLERDIKAEPDNWLWSHNRFWRPE